MASARHVLSSAEAEALWDTTASASAFEHGNPGEDYRYIGIRRERRLLDMAEVSDALQVWKDDADDMEFGVNAGLIHYRGAVVTYAGATEQTLTDDATNYIYLDLTTGAAVLTVNTTGFPTDGSATPHIRLATILTADSTFAYTDITDYRDSGAWSPVDMGDVFAVEENTAGSGSPNVLTAGESGKVLSNEGSAATNYHTLPTAVAGLTFTFVNADASDLMRIVAGASDKIVVGATATKAAGYIESTARWDKIVLVAVDEEYWVAISFYGTWTVETS